MQLLVLILCVVLAEACLRRGAAVALFGVGKDDDAPLDPSASAAATTANEKETDAETRRRRAALAEQQRRRRQQERRARATSFTRSLWLVYIVFKTGLILYYGGRGTALLARGTFPAAVEYALALPSARPEGSIAVGWMFYCVETVVGAFEKHALAPQ